MRTEPRATYRLQFTPEFGFDAAARVVPYLARLGVSHVYASPYLQAAKGSTHGYDVVDPTRVNDELGGAEAHARFCAALEAAGLAQMIDLVPNHMAITGGANPWWWDVLENGSSSPYATYFDVDWLDSSETRWNDKVLLPVLGDHYGRALERGELKLTHAHPGMVALVYFDHTFPLDPNSFEDLLEAAARRCGSELLRFLGESCGRLPQPTIKDRFDVDVRHRDKLVLQGLLARACAEEPGAAEAIDAEIAYINAHADLLDRLLQRQNYRLAYWRTARMDLGYRRFFDINDMAGLRAEDETVFRATHELPLKWVREGSVHGLRIDHCDGLRNPRHYFERLREAAPDAWIVAEKILEPGERLPDDWPIAGTSGYDFLNILGGLFIDPQAEAALTDCYAAFIGERHDFGGMVRDCKRQVLAELLGSDLRRLTALFQEICELNPRYRDFTRDELHAVLLEVAACFPVYRSYVRVTDRALSEDDVKHIEAAIETAREHRPELDGQALDFMKELLLLRVQGAAASELAIRFQQLTGPAMAKGLEDTAFYRYHRLIALNEVGGDPARFGVTLEQFHAECAYNQQRHPQTMLASSTHDTKRSEDVRARLAVLTELPGEWATAVVQWSGMAARHWGDGERDANAEYLLFQTLVGAWPISVERMQAFIQKAAREAKQQTAWTQVNEAYEARLAAFVEAMMADAALMEAIGAFAGRLIEAGRVNSLAATLLKLTAPGVPDIYQGTELWDLSLVDPDNRRPVDYAAREAALERAERLSVEQALEQLEQGLPKLWLIARTLALRARRPQDFGLLAAYAPLHGEGERAEHLTGFLRGDGVAVLARRFTLRLAQRGGWGETRFTLPEGRWRNVLTDEGFAGGELAVGSLMARFPVALLEQEA